VAPFALARFERGAAGDKLVRVDGRIEHGFRERICALARFRGDEPVARAEQALGEAAARAGGGAMSVARALTDAWLAEVEGAKRAWAERGSSDVVPPPWARFDSAHPPRFLCDPSLAGLARWLRAAGYEALLASDVPGHRLPDEALGRGLVLLTTEAEVLDRRIVADGSLVVVWLPSALTMSEQLRMAALDLGLGLREPRCMACGGTLVPTPKEAVRSRIPPRTALWKDEYFVCADCSRLFWRGTHWERIARTLRSAVAA
jgi:uncharacterized protein with PIN domain